MFFFNVDMNNQSSHLQTVKTLMSIEIPTTRKSKKIPNYNRYDNIQ